MNLGESANATEVSYLNKVRKAVIPAAGLGTRFLPATKAQPKEMLPVVDKPAIQYVVEEAITAGLDDILIVTGRSKRSIEDHFDRSFELEHYLKEGRKEAELEEIRAISHLAEIHYVRQGEPKGLGHAVAAARSHVGNEPFVVLLADDVAVTHSTLLTEMLDQYYRNGRSVIAVREVPMSEIHLYGCVDPEYISPKFARVSQIVEKPSIGEAPSNLAVTGRYIFTPEIFDSIAKTSEGKNGEIQLTDAISLLLEKQAIYALVTDEVRYDIGNKVDFLRATVETALNREDLGGVFREVLAEIVMADERLAKLCTAGLREAGESIDITHKSI
ncbi:MAG: UTP--glucose-1-phosphate uridylyltransferase GalU [Actinomycetota bacterium]|nr:UTP--glucose-1-phosphate uridylyltransferase GalU [Actinomycetota bacterium]